MPAGAHAVARTHACSVEMQEACPGRPPTLLQVLRPRPAAPRRVALEAAGTWRARSPGGPAVCVGGVCVRTGRRRLRRRDFHQSILLSKQKLGKVGHVLQGKVGSKEGSHHTSSTQQQVQRPAPPCPAAACAHAPLTACSADRMLCVRVRACGGAHTHLLLIQLSHDQLQRPAPPLARPLRALMHPRPPGRAPTCRSYSSAMTSCSARLSPPGRCMRDATDSMSAGVLKRPGGHARTLGGRGVGVGEGEW